MCSLSLHPSAANTASGTTSATPWRIAVQKLVDAVYENPVLRASIGLRGTVTFESHTNLGTVDGSLSVPLEPAPISGSSAGEAALAPPAAVRKRRRVAKGKGKGNRADQFCIYRSFLRSSKRAFVVEMIQRNVLPRQFGSESSRQKREAFVFAGCVCRQTGGFRSAVTRLLPGACRC
ncbi:hypothetical protein N657DRAFT_374789 [Parathielavia appendiculata]|uniref:Uncharacterized protein n=1 Tax=Parathielavia appendiculata TaxID=2587402 RepID=A0AAN6YYK7_9PEZI|nr:hypothetical protein N657DRAFT_374789 [Parathielavia appendiculata]